MSFKNGDNPFANRYQIVEANGTLMISESRVSLFDVMILHDEGDSIYEISMTYNLTPLQVQTAVDYIKKHRATLEPELAAAIRAREERERYYRAIQKEIEERIAKEPMTPQRAAFYALRAKNRQAEVQGNAADLN
ncbi:MAG: hypothetical protein ACOYNY_36980 [Caldilineaceae bacterium]